MKYGLVVMMKITVTMKPRTMTNGSMSGITTAHMTMMGTNGID